MDENIENVLFPYLLHPLSTPLKLIRKHMYSEYSLLNKKVCGRKSISSGEIIKLKNEKVLMKIRHIMLTVMI